MELPTYWERALIGSEPIDRQTDVSLSLAKHVLAEANRNTNFVFSPLCLHHSLGLIAVGSRGRTQGQILSYCKSWWIEKLLSLHSVTMDFAKLPCLSFANGLWADRTHKLTLPHEHRIDVINRTYNKPGLDNSVDFQNKAQEATNTINTWAEEKTNGLVKDLVPWGWVDSTTRVVLANALHFKGAWSEKFDASLTKDGAFFLSDGNSVQVPFMISSYHQEKQPYVGAFDDFKVLRLPFFYAGNKDESRLSMFFFLPDAKDGLPALLEKFGSIRGFIQGHLPRERVGEIRIPKFRISSGFEASRVFEEQGKLDLPFWSSDDLINMVDPAVGVSAIFHKSVIEVDEQGGELVNASSAAASSSESRRCDEVEGGLDFVADHPFLFAVVREDIGGVVLLVGQVVNPVFVPAAA